jgi:pimeloyl-ACP methyl ester carboxylesterase
VARVEGQRRQLRLGPVARGWLFLAAGLVGVVVGIGVGLWHIGHETLDVPAILGLTALVFGVVLVGAGSWLLLRAAHGWRKLAAVPVALVAVAFVVYPLVPAVAATTAPRAVLGDATPADRGLEFEDVRLPTADGVRLAAWYVPSRNGAAVVLLPGASSTRTSVLDQAEVLASGGYGVLLVDARGHGESTGRAMDFGWYGDLDVAAAVDHLADRPDVDPARIGAVGLSLGGEVAIGAMAADDRIRAVVAEGATGRTYGDKGWLPRSVAGYVQRAIDRITDVATDVLTSADPPIALREAVAVAAPRRVLLVAAGDVPAGVEVVADRWIATGSPDTVDVWVVPRARHIGGYAVVPAEWTVRVLRFLDGELDQT